MCLRKFSVVHVILMQWRLKVQSVKNFRKPGIEGSLPDSVFHIQDSVGLASFNTGLPEEMAMQNGS